MKILTIGDSITKGTYTRIDDWRPEGIVKVSFSDIVKDRLNYDVLENLGINGVSYSSLSPVLSDYALANRVNEFVGADTVIVCAGTNDYGTNVPLGKDSDKEDVSFFGAVDVVLRGIKKNNPNADLYVLTPIPRYDAFNGLGLCLDDYRKAIAEKAKEYGYKIIDGSKVPIDPTRISDRKLYMLDGVHINGRGHRLVAEEILSVVKNENAERVKSDDIYTLLEDAKNGDTITLPKNKTIDFWSDDCKRVYGYHFSNTASYEENPNGERPTALFLKDKKNIVIDGNGCKIVLHGIFTPFVFDNCTNIVLKNLTFDYARPTMNEFFVQKDGDGFVLDIHKDCLFEVENNELKWKGELKFDGEPFWKYDYRDLKCISMYKDLEKVQTCMMDSEENHAMPIVPEFEKIEKISANKVKVVLKNKNAFFPDKSVVQTRMTTREQIGGCFYECKNVKMTNLVVNAMHGFGILAQNCENVKYEKVSVLPCKHRTIASNADFFQFSGCSGTLTVKKCSFEGGHDDFINIHGTHLRIVEKTDGGLIVRFMNPYSRGFKSFEVGDVIDFINKDTLRPYGSTKVLGYKKLNDTDIFIQISNDSDVHINDCVENATKTPKVRITNNTFGASMSRGILCTTRKDIIIKNNLFSKNGGSVLVVEDDCNFWFESGYVNRLCFKNNVIDGCGYGYNRGVNVPVVSVNPRVIKETEDCFVHNKIVIKGNKFVNTPENAKRIDVKYTKKLEFTNNTLDGKFRVDDYKVKNLKNRNKVKI